MKTLKDVKIGDIIYLKTFMKTLSKAKVTRISHDFYETRFYFINQNSIEGSWFVYNSELSSTYSAGIYSCIEAILNDVNNETF